MAEVLLFHHLHGLTPGVRSFAETLEQAGHTVHVPDLYEGRVFETFDEGAAYAEQAGFDTIIDRGRAAADKLPAELVYAGFSLGVLPAQMLAQTRAGAKGALLFHSCVPVSEFGGTWPGGVPVQIHGMDADPLFAGEGDLEAARAVIRRARRQIAHRARAQLPRRHQVAAWTWICGRKHLNFRPLPYQGVGSWLC
jgi:dienelactone hydrolase